MADGKSWTTSDDTGGVIKSSEAGSEKKKWWRRLGQPTPPAAPAQRILAAILFGGIVVGGFDSAYLRIFFTDRAAMGRHFTTLPDYQTQSYRLFLQGVRKQTPWGSSIALLVPMRHWNDGYAYAYYRASYFLAGRRVIPLVSPDDQAHLERARETDFIAAWEIKAPIPEERIVWRGHDGVLVRGRPR